MNHKIVNYETALVGNPWKNWLFLRLETDTGTEGFAEASLNGFVRSVATAVSELDSYFINQSPFDVNKIVQNMLYGIYSDGGQIHRAAIAAVEAACWDIVGKTLDQPVWNLWGGKVRDEVRLYANGWYQAERDPEVFAEKAIGVVNMGYTAMKFDPFGSVRGVGGLGERELSLEIIRAVQDAVPKGTELMIEGHCRFDVPTAHLLANDLASLGVSWFEEPVNHRNINGLIEIARRSPVRIATGENFTSFGEFFDLCAGSKNFILQPDPMNLGGLKAARQICELAESIDMPVAPHDAQGPMSKAMCLQLAAISPAVAIQEDFEEFNPEWTRDLSETIEKKDGWATIPVSPGLGRELHWDKLADHPYDADATLLLHEPGWEQRSGSGASK